jgi:hypothetical protein
MITETQNTTTNSETVTGTLFIRLENVTISDFLRYRAEVRSIVGYGNICLTRTGIEEKALVTNNNLDTKPDIYRDAQAAPMPQEFGGGFAVPTRRLPGQEPKAHKIPYEPPKPREKKPKVKTPKMQPRIREFLKSLIGLDSGSIVSAYHDRFKHTKIPDQGIMEMYNRVHNLG